MRARLISAARGNADLVVVAALALTVAINNLAAADSPSVLRFALAMSIGLVLPGLLLATALFPNKETLDGTERFGLGLALNAVIVIVVSLLLSEVKIRLDVDSITLSLSGVTVLLAAAAAVRRTAIPSGAIYRLRVPTGRYPLLTYALLLSIALLTWSIVGANLRDDRPDFWISGSGGSLSGYPYQVPMGSRYMLTLHIDNPSPQRVSYRLVETESGGMRPLDERRVVVAADADWALPLALPSQGPPRPTTVRWALYASGSGLADDTRPARLLWVRYSIAP